MIHLKPARSTSANYAFGIVGLRERPPNAPANSKDMLMNVSDIMRRSFATIKPDAPLLDAAHLLIETNQRGLLVIDHDGALVGVISEGDFLHRTELDISPPPETGWKNCLASKKTRQLAGACVPSWSVR